MTINITFSFPGKKKKNDNSFRILIYSMIRMLIPCSYSPMACSMARQASSQRYVYFRVLSCCGPTNSTRNSSKIPLDPIFTFSRLARGLNYGLSPGLSNAPSDRLRRRPRIQLRGGQARPGHATPAAKYYKKLSEITVASFWFTVLGHLIHMIHFNFFYLCSEIT